MVRHMMRTDGLRSEQNSGWFIVIHYWQPHSEIVSFLKRFCGAVPFSVPKAVTSQTPKAVTVEHFI